MKRNPLAMVIVFVLTAGAWGGTAPKIVQDGPPLEGTARLEMQGDITSQLVDGADRFLLSQIEKSVAGRARFWKRDFGSPEKYQLSLGPDRDRLAHILGVRDPRVGFDVLELLANTWQPALVGEGTGFRAYAVGAGRPSRRPWRGPAIAPLGSQRWPTSSPCPTPIKRPR